MIFFIQSFDYFVYASDPHTYIFSPSQTSSSPWPSPLYQALCLVPIYIGEPKNIVPALQQLRV